MTGGLASGTLGAFRHQEFRLLFLGLISGNTGIWLQEFATGLLVVQLAAEDGHPELAALYLGIRSIAGAVPAIALGPFAGVYADRVDRRTLLVTTRSVSALVALALAASVLTDAATMLVVILLSAASSAAFAFDPPGRQAMLPTIVPVRDLFSALGLTRAGMQAASAIGPLFGGALIGPIGIGGILLVRAVLDVACIATLYQMRPQPAPPNASDVGVLGSLADGLRYVRSDTLIWWTVLMQVVFAASAQPVVQLLPALTVDALHASAVELSWLIGSLAVGAVVGAVLIAGSRSIERRGVVMLAAMIVTGVVLTLLGLQRTLVGSMLALFVIGVLQQLYLGMQAAVLQLSAPDRFRGRVLGMQSLIFMGATPFGVLIFGALGSAFGIANAFVMAGVVLLGAGSIAMLRLRIVRGFRTSRAPLALPERGPEARDLLDHGLV